MFEDLIMWTAFKTMVEQLFNALTIMCGVAEKAAKIADNIATSGEVNSRSLIPTPEEIELDIEVSLLQRQVAKAEQIKKLMLKVKDDPVATKALEDKLTELQKANLPKQPKP